MSDCGCGGRSAGGARTSAASRPMPKRWVQWVMVNDKRVAGPFNDVGSAWDWVRKNRLQNARVEPAAAEV